MTRQEWIAAKKAEEAIRYAAQEAIRLELNGDTWRVVAIGTAQGGKVFCHLASTTRFNHHRNGACPIQMSDWVADALIPPAAIPAANRH